jgi:hypothetical protein
MGIKERNEERKRQYSRDTHHIPAYAALQPSCISDIDALLGMIDKIRALCEDNPCGPSEEILIILKESNHANK